MGTYQGQIFDLPLGRVRLDKFDPTFAEQSIASDEGVIVRGYWGFELVRARGNRWLVAHFRAHTAERCGAIFLGIVTWRGCKPTYRHARTPKDIAPFL